MGLWVAELRNEGRSRGQRSMLAQEGGSSNGAGWVDRPTETFP